MNQFHLTDRESSVLGASANEAPPTVAGRLREPA